MRNAKFAHTQVILKALEFTLAKGGFAKSAAMKKTAAGLVKTMKSSGSVSGRHQHLVAMLKKGVTLAQMIKVTAASRRTVFRYLNHFEDAGLNIVLVNGKYKIK